MNTDRRNDYIGPIIFSKHVFFDLFNFLDRRINFSLSTFLQYCVSYYYVLLVRRAFLSEISPPQFWSSCISASTHFHLPCCYYYLLLYFSVGPTCHNHLTLAFQMLSLLFTTPACYRAYFVCPDVLNPLYYHHPSQVFHPCSFLEVLFNFPQRPDPPYIITHLITVIYIASLSRTNIFS